jgi:hypothetical protein
MSSTVIVIGAGACGMIASIVASRANNRVVLLEKLNDVGVKLKASGGGRCNLTNTLPNDIFMEHFRRDGRFISDALEMFDSSAVREFFLSIGVETVSKDGFRVFPVGHSSKTILKALKNEMSRVGVEVLCNQRVESIEIDGGIKKVTTLFDKFEAQNIIIATGGLGYPLLGSDGDGYGFAKEMGHKVTPLYPAMMPLKVKESWVNSCRADTVAKVELRVNLKKYKKLYAKGDLIFSKDGIRGPVVLDFSREITPLLDKLDEVPLIMNLTKGLNQEQIRDKFKKIVKDNRDILTIDIVQTILPLSIAQALCDEVEADSQTQFSKLQGAIKDKLISILAQTPLTITGHDGFKMAMVTRGGVSLKDINPKNMESRLVDGVYFCGEVLNLDGPCGGYNLQWSFSSGFLAGRLL